MDLGSGGKAAVRGCRPCGTRSGCDRLPGADAPGYRVTRLTALGCGSSFANCEGGPVKNKKPALSQTA
jgi:hypothetical protein